MSSCCGMGKRHYHDLWGNHGDLMRKPNPGNEVFSILDTLLSLRANVIMWLGSVFSGRACASFSVLYTTLPGLRDLCSPIHGRLLPYLSPPSVTALSTTHGPFPSSVILTSPSRICSSKRHCKWQCVVVPSIASCLVLSRCCCTPSGEEWSRANFHGLHFSLGCLDPVHTRQESMKQSLEQVDPQGPGWVLNAGVGRAGETSSEDFSVTALLENRSLRQ